MFLIDLSISEIPNFCTIHCINETLFKYMWPHMYMYSFFSKIITCKSLVFDVIVYYRNHHRCTGTSYLI